MKGGNFHMNYLIFSITIPSNSVADDIISRELKEIPYGIKTRIKNMKSEYGYVMVKVIDEECDEFSLFSGTLANKVSENVSELELKSLYKITKKLLFGNYDFSIDIVSRISDNDFDILYTDGSCRKSDATSSYACCKLTEEDLGNSMLDNYTGKSYSYYAFNGTIQNGTNNVGELTAIKIASENFGNKTYQLIISDSEYSIKSFREWYYTWKDNDFRNYANTPIKNEELIKDTWKSLFSKNKIVMFKWTHGHTGDMFNEKCDELAKNILGIKK